MPSFLGLKRNKGSKTPDEAEYASQAPRPNLAPALAPQAVNRAIPPQVNATSEKKVARDLWAEAFASLSQEDREVLRPVGTDGKPSNAISRQLALDNVGKVMELTEFKDVIDNGLKFDPSGYGTIVWGVLSGVLTLVQNDKDKVDAVFDSAAVLARYLPKYAILEDQYRDRQTQEQNAFEDQIKQVYAAILKYSACVQKELSRSVVGRIFDSFWTLDNQDVKILKDGVESKDRIVTNQSQFVAHQYRKQEFKELEGKATETLSKIDISVEKLLKAERLSTLRWLSDTPLTDKQQQLRSQAEKVNKNSGFWLLENSGYTNWLAQPDSFIWLHGASGCGKSTLCSTVIKTLVESAEQNSNMIVAYWYFDNADLQTQNLQRLLRLVLRRIAAKATPFPPAVRDLANKHEVAGSAPSTVVLVKALKETIATLDEDIFLILDAVDEYQSGDETLQEEFLDLLVMLGDAQLQKLHILVTSISGTDIENAFKRLRKPAAEIDVEKQVSVDVNAYLDATIKKYADAKHWSPEIVDKIYNVLKDDGRFRIVTLQLEDLRKCYDENEIDEALKSIPRDIEDAYLRKLQGVIPKDVKRLCHIFYWISVAMRQLTVVELAAAPGVGLPSPDELFNICPSGMIRLEKPKSSGVDRADLVQQEEQETFNTDTHVVTFDHPSVKRFLYSRKLQQSSDDQLSPFFVSEKTVNAEFVNLMVGYLLEVKQPKIKHSTIAKSPFLQYAAQYWHEHLGAVKSIPNEDEVLKTRLMALFGAPMNPAYLNWIRVWNPETQMSDFGLTEQSCPSPLYVSIFLKFESISEYLIDQRSYINGTGGLMHTTLQLASQREYTELIEKLIASGEDVGKFTDDQPTAFYIAVETGNAKLVQMLLAAGASPDEKHAPLGSALQLASFRGFGDIIESLLASKADVNLVSGRFGTALQAAAAAGHNEIVIILLKNGAKPDVVGGLLGTAIQAAATGGNDEVVKQLVDKGIAWDEKRDTVWHEAYDLWISQASRPKALEGFFSNELFDGSDTQRLLATLLKYLSSGPAPGQNPAFQSRHRTVPRELEALRTKSLKLMDLVRRQGQEGIESANYVYRALFWVLVLRCRANAISLNFNASRGEIEFQSVIYEAIYKLSILVIQRASDQKVIEHSTSENMMTARHELVEYYNVAFRVVMQLSMMATQSQMNRFKRFLIKPESNQINELLQKLEEQNERFELVMKMVRDQEPSTEDTLGKMQHALLASMQQEMRESFQTLEDGMQKRLAEVEQRVVASVRDMLPAIIREEMRKLLVELKEAPGT
ncbi:hypothetical protein BX600DRAFT_499745 [Xylariales sp. PMI_506]|nr:hypothetical protein BX600DRAFT_499745 [Xylariales sp. PMI_506]